eukprot:scaffold1298_cov382-Prasinococcus_capsulatus_cf.AAC.17
MADTTASCQRGQVSFTHLEQLQAATSSSFQEMCSQNMTLCVRYLHRRRYHGQGLAYVYAQGCVATHACLYNHRDNGRECETLDFSTLIYSLERNKLAAMYGISRQLDQKPVLCCSLGAHDASYTMHVIYGNEAFAGQPIRLLSALSATRRSYALHDSMRHHAKNAVDWLMARTIRNVYG